MNKIIFIILITLFISSCGNKNKRTDFILYADREAPIGWLYLKIYKDSTFDFIYRSFPSSKIHSGVVTIKNDTLNFNYYDSIPAVGNKALIDRRHIRFVNGSYDEVLEISLDSITTK